jgi:hypothetical protein
MLLNMTREEKAFISACIQLRSEAEKEEQRKMKAKKPHRGR